MGAEGTSLTEPRADVDNFAMSITCDACGACEVVVRANLEDVLDEDPSIAALLEPLWRRGWVHDAVHGFAFCSDVCARAHGVDERPDDRWLRWALRDPA